MLKKTYSSVLDLVRDTSETSDLPQTVKERIGQRQVVKRLMALRAARGLSQQQIAAFIGCTQSKVSKLERSRDNELRLGEVRDYLAAVGLELRFVLCPQPWPVSQQIQFYVDRIRGCLTTLIERTQADSGRSEGVQSFHVELLLKSLQTIADSAQRLPTMALETPGIMEPDRPTECPAEDDSGHPVTCAGRLVPAG